MSRRHSAKKKVIVPDHRYNSVLISKFINIVMFDGKKSVAEKIVYKALEEASQFLKESPMVVFSKVLDNVKPSVEVRSRRVGGSTYQVPVEVNLNRAVSLAFKWIKLSFQSRSKGDAIKKLKLEILDAYIGKGASVKKREECSKMAESNRAFAHYRWSQ